MREADRVASGERLPCIGACLVSASAGAGVPSHSFVFHAPPPKQMPDADGALVSFRGGTYYTCRPAMEMATAAAGRQ